MAGRSASVLLPAPLTEPDHARLRQWLEAVSGEEVAGTFGEFDFHIADTRPVAGGYVGDGRPFALHTGLQPDWEWEPDELPQVAAAFGFTPVDEILLIAFCSREEDHRVLGELSAWLAEQFRGVVCFWGALTVSVPSVVGLGYSDSDWRELERHFRQSIEGLPGRIVGLPYEAAPGRTWVTHFADAVFARAWLRHPQFHMTG